MGCVATTEKKDNPRTKDIIRPNVVRRHARADEKQQQEEAKERMRLEVLKKKNQEAPKLHLEKNSMYQQRVHHEE